MHTIQIWIAENFLNTKGADPNLTIQVGYGVPLKMPLDEFQLLDMRHTTPLPTIAVEISEATRSLHREVNNAIVANMPFGLPPRAKDLKPYLGGLAAFAHLYTTFERAASDVTSSRDKALQKFVARAVPESLKRTTQLRRDLDYTQHKANVTAEQLFYTVLQRTAKALVEWKQDFETRVKAKPHILVAYFWCMYMAIFAGGQFIKLELANAGVAFWEQTTSDGNRSKKAPLDHLGYSFLSFSGTGDANGITIAEDFKKRLIEGEDVLTIEQRKEIVSEAQHIFRTLTRVVNALAEDTEHVSLPSSATLSKRATVSTPDEKSDLPPPPVPHRPERPINTWIVAREVIDIVLVCVLFAATWQIFVAIFM